MRVASDFVRHAEMLAAGWGPSDSLQQAIVTDWCLAIERLFPDLRDALPA
jgi:hypothetical protein